MKEKLTAEALAKMKLGGRPKIFRCDNAAEFASAQQNAYYIKRNCPRPDGTTYNISSSVKAMVVTISVIKPSEDE